MQKVSPYKASQVIARDAVDGAGMQVELCPSAVLQKDRCLVGQQLANMQHGSNRVHKHG